MWQCDDGEAKTHSQHTIRCCVSITQNESRIRVHDDKNHVMLTASLPSLPEPLSPDTPVSVGCLSEVDVNS